MCRVPIEDAAAERARWLAELAEALEQARTRCLAQLERCRRQRVEAIELYARIEAARLEVQALRFEPIARRAAENLIRNGPNSCPGSAAQLGRLDALRQVSAAARMARGKARAAAASSPRSRRRRG